MKSQGRITDDLDQKDEALPYAATLAEHNEERINAHIITQIGVRVGVGWRGRAGGTPVVDPDGHVVGRHST